MATKSCPGCERTLDHKHFYRNRSRRSGRSDYCKSCTISINEGSRPRKGIVRGEKPTRLSMREHVQQIKATTPCVDCGVQYPSYVMHCDHVRGEKVAGIASLVRRGNWKTLLAELEKCEVRCANCHYLSHGGKLEPKS